MKRIVIERYDAAKHDDPDGEWPYSGLIEGETDDGQTWIMWVDKKGRPETFWPKRDKDGAVVGPGTPLHSTAAVDYLERSLPGHIRNMRKVYQDILDKEDPIAELQRIVNIYDQQIAKKEAEAKEG